MTCMSCRELLATEQEETLRHRRQGVAWHAGSSAKLSHGTYMYQYIHIYIYICLFIYLLMYLFIYIKGVRESESLQSSCRRALCSIGAATLPHFEMQRRPKKSLCQDCTRQEPNLGIILSFCSQFCIRTPLLVALKTCKKLSRSTHCQSWQSHVRERTQLRGPRGEDSQQIFAATLGGSLLLQLPTPDSQPQRILRSCDSKARGTSKDGSCPLSPPKRPHETEGSH